MSSGVHMKSSALLQLLRHFTLWTPTFMYQPGGAYRRWDYEEKKRQIAHVDRNALHTQRSTYSSSETVTQHPSLLFWRALLF